MNTGIKILLVLTFCGAISTAKSQCVITAIKPGEVFTIDQLWNVIISGPIPPGQYKLNMELVSARQSVYLAETNPFNYNNKSLTINYAGRAGVEPLNLKHIDPNFNSSLMQAAGIVPDGKYTVEFTLIAVGATGAEELCKTTYRLNVDKDIAPLQLLFVHKEDTIKEMCPTFGWIPPYPLPSGDYHYELVLTECFDGQQPFDATTKNMPICKVSAGTNIQKNVCGEVSNLKPGKSYAWKINLYTGGKFDNTSESWRFYYDPEDSIEIFEPEQYYVMDQKAFASYITIDSNMLPIYFKEDYNVIDSIIDIVLYDSLMNIYATGEEILFAYNNGSNFSYLNFCNYEFDLAQGLYLLEITCINDKKYFIRFKNESELTDCY